MKYLLLVFVFLSCNEKNTKNIIKSDCSIKSELCRVTHPLFEHVEFSIEKEKFHMNEAIPVRISSGKSIDKVSVELQGIEMDMGYNKPLLQGEGKVFQGKLFIPMCTEKKMTYKMIFHLVKEKKEFLFQFILPVEAK